MFKYNQTSASAHSCTGSSMTFFGIKKNAGRQLISLKALVNLSNDKRKTTRAQSARASTQFSLDIENVPDFQTENKSEKL